MKKKGQNVVAWGAMLFGGICLCNPLVGFLDVLPDAVGCLLLVLGLYRLGDLNGHLADARRGVLQMLAASVGQLLVTHFIYNVLRENAENQFERPMLLLLGAAAYGFLTFLLLGPALRNLFLGLDELALRTGGRVADETKAGAGSPCERMWRRTRPMLIAVVLASILPELSILTSQEIAEGSGRVLFDWYRFLTLFRWAAVLLSLFAVLPWLVAYVRLVIRMWRDTAWNAQLEKKYAAEVAADAERCEKRRYFVAALLGCIGICCCFRIKMNHVTLLPSALCACGIGAGLWMMRDRVPLCRMHAWILGGSVLASVAQTVLNRVYLARFELEASKYREEAYLLFLALRGSEVLEALLLLAVELLLLKGLCDLCKSDLRVTYEGDEERSARATERLRQGFTRRLHVLFTVAILTALSNVAFAILQLYIPWLWFVSLLLSGLFVGLCVSFWSAFSEERIFHAEKSIRDA